MQLYGASSTNGCSALQTYKVGSDGGFTFLGDSYSNIGVHGMAYQTVVSRIAATICMRMACKGSKEQTCSWHIRGHRQGTW